MAARSRQYAVVLGLLALAFSVRVLGQAAVAFLDVKFLPPMDAWYSGLVPYTALLPIQLAILVLQAKVSVDLWRNSGFFAVRRPRIGRSLCWFSFLYFAIMLLRYVVTMVLYPQQRWLGGTIPIFFHWVLAAYLYVLGWFQNGLVDSPTSRTENHLGRSP
jgi:hypothetical protein